MKIYNIIKISLFFFFITLGLNCTKIQEEPSAVTLDPRNIPDQESWQSTITLSKNGKMFAKVWSGYIASFNEKRITLLRDSIHIDFYDKDGNHNSVLTADSGMVYNESNDLVAFGRVVVLSDSGIILETEQLHWDDENQKIVSKVPVRFTTDQDTLMGDSFISDPDLRNYEIRNARGYSRRKFSVEK
jgi:LPS export ABC transporter protein LptC